MATPCRFKSGHQHQIMIIRTRFQSERLRIFSISLVRKAKAAVSHDTTAFGMLPRSSGHFVPKMARCSASPAGNIPFQMVIQFSRGCWNVCEFGLTEKNAIPGFLKELHFYEIYTFGIAFLQVFCDNGNRRRKCVFMALPGTPGQRRTACSDG